jgi:hypothetical protein
LTKKRGDKINHIQQSHTTLNMPKTRYTNITALPPSISRLTVLETLHSHIEMIDLNPSHESRVPIKPPPEATPEEYHCAWYQITDRVSYLPANMYTGKVVIKSCFHDLGNGLQTHVYVPLGIEIKTKWTVGGNEPGEPVLPVEIGTGAPVSGLYLREDIELKCNFLLTSFVKKTLKDSLATLVARLVVKSELVEAVQNNHRLTYNAMAGIQNGFPPQGLGTPPMSPQLSPPLSYRDSVQNESPPMSPPHTAGLPTGNMDHRPSWAQEKSPGLNQHPAFQAHVQTTPSSQPQSLQSQVVSQQLKQQYGGQQYPPQGYQGGQYAGQYQGQGQGQMNVGGQGNKRVSLPQIPPYNPADYGNVRISEMDANHKRAVSAQGQHQAPQFGMGGGIAELP